MALTFTLKLSKRRQRMAEAIEAGVDNPSAAEFDYRRRVQDDVEAFLQEAEVFTKRLGGSDADRYEARALTRRLAEDITRYITQ